MLGHSYGTPTAPTLTATRKPRLFRELKRQSTRPKAYKCCAHYSSGNCL